MSRVFTPILASALALLAASPAASQRPDPSVAQKQAIGRLSHWVGEWQGAGWSMRGPGAREEFTVHESVQPKLGGVVLLVEGRGEGSVAGGKETVIGHDALAVVSYDTATKSYRFQHYTMQGGAGQDELVLTEDGMSWELESAGLPFRMRFMIKIDGDTWSEYGEMSRDGENWTRTMEMTLTRIKS